MRSRFVDWRMSFRKTGSHFSGRPGRSRPSATGDALGRFLPGLRRPLAAGALAKKIERLRGLAPDRLDIDAQDPAAEFENPAIHDHGIDVRGGRAVQNRGVPIV